uniref:Small ribosomal subunit protein mS31 n=1 Tax=Gouania willdenowi TaxID=441366 RepID=A0A8C5EN47_GOUWI
MPTNQQASKRAVMESTTSMFQRATEKASTDSEELNPALVAAASAAASTLPNPHQAESELLRQLRKRKAMSDAQKKANAESLGVIIADMKVGKRAGRQSSSPAGQILFDDDGRGFTADKGITAELASVHRRCDPLNPLTLSTNQMPLSGFEEMIQWTKEDKLWAYPINNEAGLEEEASVPFHEHIFLEKHLEEGFPDKGPVRHFMELVVGGLSRNPYLSVQHKKEHIAWFREYFHQKEDVLKEADNFLN